MRVNAGLGRNVRGLTLIDIHTHVLPGIDDGPADLAGSLAIARRAVHEGIGTIVATPHASSRYPNEAETIAAPLAAVRDALRRESIPLEVLSGAEIAVTHLPEIEEDSLAELALGGGEWLLIEPPFATVAPGLETAIHRVMRNGHKVVLAHPERCPAIHRDPEIVRRLVSRGVVASLTAGSLTGRFGSQTRRFAVELLHEGLAQNVASDTHDESNRPPAIAEQIAGAGFGELAPWLSEEVPAAILAGEAIPRRPAVRTRRSRLWPLRR